MKPLIERLRAIVGDDGVLTSGAALAAYEGDASQDRGAPTVVALPRNAAEVAEVVHVARQHSLPIVPRGAGTGLSGGAVAVEGGIVVATTRLNRIRRLDLANRLAVVEPGVVNAELTKTAAPHGLYYAPDPSSQPACTIGGNVAENAGGAHCLAHGVTTNHVLALEAVLIPTGQVVRVGGPAHDRPGYDLMGLLVGSEGTLAIVTEITVRLLARAEGVAAVLAAFDGVVPASEAVSAIIGQGIVPVALEMMDGMTTRAVAQGAPASLPEDAGAVLLIECEGLREELDDKDGPLATVQAICRAHGARDLRIALSESDRNALWKARKSARGALGTLAPNCYVHDGVVPRSKIPTLMARIEAVAAEFDVPIATYLHAGDGNVHPNVLFDARRPTEVRQASAAGEAILRACLDLGGVLSGEHGIGTEKQDYMSWALTTTDLRAQAHVKLAFDPDEQLNPRKLFPTPGFCGEVRGASRPPREPAAQR
ncbi:MAG: FAD-binding oxidoreductase [Dehalococcoidia bacterium]|nr:FAD-binding oxidoreductase [Dehalococcoidia bacterium]